MGENYDVGILGVWYGCNYGSIATYYSLYCAVRDMGKSVLMVHRPWIEPFDENKLQSESYDISIGDQITIFRKEIRCLDVSEQSTIDDIYEVIKIEPEGYIKIKKALIIRMNESLEVPNLMMFW